MQCRLTEAFLQVWLQGDELIWGGTLGLTLGPVNGWPIMRVRFQTRSTLRSWASSASLAFVCCCGRISWRLSRARCSYALMQGQVVFSSDWQSRAAIIIAITAVLIFILLRIGFVATISALIFRYSFEAMILGVDWKTWYAPIRDRDVGVAVDCRSLRVL